MAWSKPTNLRDWLAIYHRNKKKFFFPCVTAIIAVVTASHWIPREYKAEATFERSKDATLEQMGSDPLDRNVTIIRRVLAQDIKGRSAIEQLIDDLELTKELPHTDDGELTRQGQLAKNEMIWKLQNRIGVFFRISSVQMDRIAVSFTDPDRDLAPKVVNQIVENYIRRTRRQLDEMLLRAKEFFEREVSRYSALVAELESKKLRFELEHAGQPLDSPTAVEEKLNALLAQLRETTKEMQVTREKRDRLTEWVKHQPEFVEKSHTGQNPELTVVFEKIGALQVELEEHLYVMGRTEEHPAVIRTRQRLIELEQYITTIADQVVVGKEIEPNTNRIGAEREIEALSGVLAALENQALSLKGEADDADKFKRNFFVVRNNYQQLKRQLKAAEDQLTFFGKNLRQTMKALKAEIGERGIRLRPLEPAPELSRPSKPDLKGILGMACALGVGLGGAIALLSELLDHSFRGVEQAVDELKLPVLGAVNEIVTPSEMFRRKVLGWGVYPAIGAVMTIALLASIALAYLSLDNPDQYDQLIKSPGRFVEKSLFG